MHTYLAHSSLGIFLCKCYFFNFSKFSPDAIFLVFLIALDLVPRCPLSYLVCRQDEYISLICINPIFSILDNKAGKKTKNYTKK